MPGTLLHQGATIMCAHGGQAMPIATVPRVTLSGMPVAVQPIPVSVAGCSLPPNAGGPCVLGQWVTASTRITSNGMPVLLLDSQAIASPTGAPIRPVCVHSRVTGL